MSETLNFDAEEIRVEPRGGEIDVFVDVKNYSGILEEIPIKEAIDFYGAQNFLQEIGIDEAKEYWDLVSEPEEENV